MKFIDNDGMITANRMSEAQSKLAQASRRLSSGYRVNSAADDAAGLAISEKLRAIDRGLRQGQRNINDGISYLDTVDGCAQELHDMLHRMKELAVEASNDTLSRLDREAIDLEYQQLIDEMGQVTDSAEFNGIPLFEKHLPEYEKDAGSLTHEGWVTIDGTNSPLIIGVSKDGADYECTVNIPAGTYTVEEIADKIDDELLELLVRRMRVSRDIGQYKKEHNMPILQAKRYEDLLALRMPFLIDSAVYETASALRRGDEIVAINDAQGLEYPAYREYLKAHAGEDVTLTVKREGDMLLELVVPVSDEGRLGVTALNPYKLRTQKYTFWQAIPAGISKAGKVMSSYWEQLKMIVQPKTKMYEELGGHRQHLPRRLELGGFLDEDGVSVNHPRRDEHSADTGTRRRARHLHVLGDDYGPQGERQDTGGRAVRGTVYHPASAAVRQRQRHIPVFHKIR